jgi:FKBP-type peptidyl-prolyl cis-trans isomerase SlyD
MQIAAKNVATIEYTLKNDAGEVLDSSEKDEPLAYVHGVGSLVPGLEKALDGKGQGDEVEVVLAPADAYGHRDERLVQNMPLRKLPVKNPSAGMQVPVRTTEGPRLLVIKSVRGDYAVVDGNHPLAGMTLHFKVKVLDVRAATEEELEHGHVHGPGGHDH